MSLVKNVLLILLLSVLSTSCASKKVESQQPAEHECPNAKEGKLIDMTGLDGCGWMIELPNGDKLEAINLESFDMVMEANKKVKVSYTPQNEMMSICMAGAIVKIICIHEID